MSLNVKHFQANHLYYILKYEEASVVFGEILKLAPSNNFQLRREISEGLSRSFLKTNKIEEALIAANEFVI